MIASRCGTRGGVRIMSSASRALPTANAGNGAIRIFALSAHRRPGKTGSEPILSSSTMAAAATCSTTAMVTAARVLGSPFSRNEQSLRKLCAAHGKILGVRSRRRHLISEQTAQSGILGEIVAKKRWQIDLLAEDRRGVDL